ncbi:MAG: NAD(P)H-binding protein [Acidobacteriia bacterium]|nr:NAD(P)H-binding protein [Terriglobia bacterium]
MGRRLIAELVRRGISVKALVRSGSKRKLPSGCAAVTGDALDKNSFASQIAPADTFVQLVGVTHPNPSKKNEFQAVDLGSAKAAIEAAREAGIKHFVYVSVAQPAPVMKYYIEVRAKAEAMLRETGMNATILRPWYVLGPGRRWPIFLKPMYWLMEQIPSTRESARRLGLVTIDQMVGALARAVENPPRGVRIVSVPEIRGESVSLS